MNDLERQALTFASLVKTEEKKTVLWRELLEQRTQAVFRNRGHTMSSNPPRTVEGMMVFLPGKGQLRNPSRVGKPATPALEQKKRIEALLSPRLSDAKLAELYTTTNTATFLHHPTPPPAPRSRRFMPSLAEQGEAFQERFSTHGYRCGWLAKPLPPEEKKAPAAEGSPRKNVLPAVTSRPPTGMKPVPPLKLPPQSPSEASVHALDNAQKETMRKFRQLDLDGDQQLSFAEFVKACHMFGKMFSKHKLHQMFDQIDADNSGQVSFQEFLSSPVMGWSADDQKLLNVASQGPSAKPKLGSNQAHKQQMQKEKYVALEMAKAKIKGHGKQDGQKLFHAFKVYDKNGDGTLSYRECIDAIQSSGLAMSKDVIISVLEDFDDNKDGNISYAEFVEEMARGDNDPRSWFKEHDTHGMLG